MKRGSLLILITLLLSAVAFAQTTPPTTPAAPPQNTPPAPKPAATNAPPFTGPVAIVSFMKAVTENGEGKKAANRYNAEFAKKQKEVAAKQKEGQDAQTELSTKGNALSEVAKTALQKKMEDVQTSLTRMQEDYQKDMAELQQTLFAPIATIVRNVLEAYSKEKGYAVVFDVSGESSNLVFWHDAVDITDELILRVDEETAKAPVRPAPGAGAPRPATPPPATNPANKAPDPTKKP